MKYSECIYVMNKFLLQSFHFEWLSVGLVRRNLTQNACSYALNEPEAYRTQKSILIIFSTGNLSAAVIWRQSQVTLDLEFGQPRGIMNGIYNLR